MFWNNGLTELPNLFDLHPPIDILYCEDNKLIKLPELPNSITEILCSFNKLIKLPKLPNKLQELK